ncbi:MAG: protein kinase [Planctomycetes bacterium]|nr:protein kinase [Planctomycetota bacterium]
MGSEAEIQAALAEFLSERKSGVEIDIESFCSRHPEFADELRDAIHDYIGIVEQSLAQDRSQPVSSKRAERGLASGSVLGDYRIIRELGRGGMGIVYLAEQVSLPRHVALKVLSPFVASAAANAERFRAEARAAAALNHPGIVKVLAIGSEGDTWYFAMEFVDGVGLDRVLERLRAHLLLPVDAASIASAIGEDVEDGGSRWRGSYANAMARIIADVAEGIEHAHRRGVIHRDVKPSNILLRRDGSAVLTDFGLARAAGSASLTQTGHLLGTPGYLAPERVGGGSQVGDARCDVFSLGVTLYECITLRRPFEGATPGEVLANILLRDPIEPARLGARVPRDVSTIVLKALEKSPSRRYPTAAAMAEDLRAYLDGRAIRARPIGPLGRLVRAARRRPAASAAVLLTLLLFIGGPIAFGLQEQVHTKRIERAFKEEQAARERAEADFRMASEAIHRMLIRVSQERLLYVPKMESVRREILEEARELYGEFLKRHEGVLSLRREVANAYYQLGEIRSRLGETVGVLEPLAKAEELLCACGAETSEEPKLVEELARVRVALGAELLHQGKATAAALEIERASELIRRGLARAPNELCLLRALGDGLRALGDALRACGRAEEAERAQSEAVATVRKVLSLEPSPSRDARVALAAALAQWAITLLDRGDGAAAIVAFESAIELRDALSREAPTGQELVSGLEGLHVGLANALARAGRYTDAKARLAAGLERLQRFTEEYPRAIVLRSDLAGTHLNLAVICDQLREHDAAVTHCERAIDVYRSLATESPTRVSALQGLASALTNLGTAALRQGAAEAARAHLEEAAATQRRVIALMPQNPAARQTLSACCSYLAMTFEALGERALAEELSKAQKEGDVSALLTWCDANLGSIK